MGISFFAAPSWPVFRHLLEYAKFSRSKKPRQSGLRHNNYGQTAQKDPNGGLLL